MGAEGDRGLIPRRRDDRVDGREVLALRHMSFRVEVWECQPELLVAANELLVAERFEPSVAYAPRNTVTAGTKMYDGLVIGWSTYTLVPGCNRPIGCFESFERGSKEVRRSCSRSSHVVRERPSLYCGWGREPGPAAPRWERMEVGDSFEPNFVHRFLEDENASELAARWLRVEVLRRSTVRPGRRGLRRVHRRLLRPADRGLARIHLETHRPGHHTAADGAMAPRRRRPPGHRRAAGTPLRRRFSVHLDQVHRPPQPRGHRPIDRVGRRRLRQRPHGKP